MFSINNVVAPYLKFTKLFNSKTNVLIIEVQKKKLSAPDILHSTCIWVSENRFVTKETLPTSEIPRIF